MKLAKISEQYENFPKLSREDVGKLLDWVQKQPHLPKITEFEVMIFLHATYGQIEAAKTKIDNYYTSRTNIPHFFNDRDVLGNDIQQCKDVFSAVPLPQPTKDGYRVMLMKLIDTDPSKFSLNTFVKFCSFTCDALLMEKGLQNGYIFLVDFQGIQLGHVARIGLMSLKNYMYYLQEALPFRIKGLHFINVVPFVDKIVFLMKPFMKKELWEVFHLHSTMESIHKYIEPEVFPSDYSGGEALPMEVLHEQHFQQLKTWREYFLEEERTRRVNEKARPGKGKDAEEILFGMEGNFKKLNFD